MPSLLIRSACAAKSAIVTGKVSDLDIWLLRRRLHALERIWRVKRATRCTASSAIRRSWAYVLMVIFVHTTGGDVTVFVGYSYVVDDGSDGIIGGG